jgi:hypothetical protein
MKRLLLMLGTCLAFAAMSMAQSSQQTSPNPNYPSPNSSPTMQQDSQQGSMANSESKGEKKLKGCIRSENGKYVLESKHHKMISLTGSEDFAPHVGHTVTLHGNFLGGSHSASSGAMSENTGTAAGTSTGAPSAGASSSGEGSDFQVTKMDMVSESCNLEGQKGTKSDKGSASNQQ